MHALCDSKGIPLTIEPRMCRHTTDDGEVILVMRTIWLDSDENVVYIANDELASPWRESLSEMTQAVGKIVLALTKPVVEALPVNETWIEDQEEGEEEKANPW